VLDRDALTQALKGAATQFGGIDALEHSPVRTFGITPLTAPLETHPSGTSSGGMSSVKALFARSYVLATVCFLAMTFLCLFMIYGFNTWLPEIMRRAGYSSGSALGFLLVFNIGAVVGTLIIPWRPTDSAPSRSSPLHSSCPAWR
jgi:sugar phosphate permease